MTGSSTTSGGFGGSLTGSQRRNHFHRIESYEMRNF